MWSKLEQLYMTKAHSNHIYLKQKFYVIKMDENMSTDEIIDDFTKLIPHLENLEIKINEDDKSIFCTPILSSIIN